MKISRDLNSPHHLLPRVTVTEKQAIPLLQWELAFWLCTPSLPEELKILLAETGYIFRAWFDSEKSKLFLEFTGNTFSKEHMPPFCITGDTKFVDKFSDLKTLDDALITKIWGNLIAFIATLPQRGDRGYGHYMALHTAYKEAVDALNNMEIQLLTSKVNHTDQKNENSKLKKKLEELESVKAQLAETQTALKVVTGLLGKS